MKIGQEGFFDLTYCSNIHSGETWSHVFQNLQDYLPKLKADLAPDIPFGIGLRLSNKAVDGLLKNNLLLEFKAWLLKNNFYVMTINAFPYGDFHHHRIKDEVYSPDWTTVERRDYSLKILRVLAELTPEGGESGFSTSPLSYKPWLNVENTPSTFRQSAIYLADVALAMATVYTTSNKLIHIDIEPEPDCLIETTEELIDFFNEWLIPVGAAHFAHQAKVTLEEAEVHIRRHIQACYDICHSSVEFEDPAHVFKSLAKAKINIGKIQVSAALKCKIHQNKQEIACISEDLFEFIDPVYLHQVIKHHKNNQLTHEMDLNKNVLSSKDKGLDEIRAHFHVPIFLDKYEHLESTQSDIQRVFELVQKNKLTRHLEIETYTWEVLPPDLKMDILSSIKREYQWIINQF
jgi:hypothetical protein